MPSSDARSRPSAPTCGSTRPFTRSGRPAGSSRSRPSSRSGDRYRGGTMTPLEIPFNHHGGDGRVLVSCVSDDDPGALGLPEHAKGFPVCTATVGSDAQGYGAVMGWLQLV